MVSNGATHCFVHSAADMTGATVVQLDPHRAGVVRRLPLSASAAPACGSRHLWLSTTDGRLVGIDPAAGRTDRSLPLPGGQGDNTSPQGLATLSSQVWVVDFTATGQRTQTTDNP